MGIPGSGNMLYEILTFPQYLVYVGDMGSYTFSRVEDRFSKSKEFDERTLTETLKQLLDNHFEFAGNKIDKPAIWADIESKVLNCMDDGEYRVREAMDSFESHGFDLSDHYEMNFQDYTYKFIWCLYAIVYAIQQYDAEKST